MKPFFSVSFSPEYQSKKFRCEAITYINYNYKEEQEKHTHTQNSELCGFSFSTFTWDKYTMMMKKKAKNVLEKKKEITTTAATNKQHSRLPTILYRAFNLKFHVNIFNRKSMQRNRLDGRNRVKNIVSVFNITLSKSN